MAHIECHSHITGRDVKYSLIGVKLKHKKKQEDYGASCLSDNRSYFNTSPSFEFCEYRTEKPYTDGPSNCGRMYTITGRGTQRYSASGVLEAEYENSNTGTNPIIASSVHSINEFKSGLNTKDLFETDTVKVVLEVIKCKISDIRYITISQFNGIDEDIEILYKVFIRYILKSSNTTIGIYELTRNDHDDYRMTFPITFAINTELFWIKDFNPINKSGIDFWDTYEMWLDSGYSNSGLHIDGTKSQEPGDFIGASFTMLCSECWCNIYNVNDASYHKYKITKDNVKIKNSELRGLNNRAGILYYRNEIATNPNEFIKLTEAKGNKYSGLNSRNATPTERTTWANNTLNTEGYVLTREGSEDSNDIFRTTNFKTTPILVPCINPSTFEIPLPAEEGMFISLTNNILEGPAPDQDPDPEPPDPETVEPADNPETEYTPPPQEAFEDFPYRGSDTITGLEPGYNAFRPSYSNYIFPKYYRDSIEGDSDWESAITFIQEACNPSAFELWGATFKLITGHPTPGEIISRVYYLPFEYNEIRGTGSAGFYLSAPVYGPIGPVTLGVKTHSEDSSNTGKPIESNVHYYQQIANRFHTINLGQVTIDRVFNNFLDYSEVQYTLNLPYAAGQVELDPDLLFKNDISVGNVKLTGVIDFDTGELTIIIQLNGQRYYETTVNVAIDRLASVADNMAAPLAIAKASMAAGSTAGGIAKFVGGGGRIPTPQTPNNDLENGGKYFDEHGYARDLEIERLKRKYE